MSDEQAVVDTVAKMGLGALGGSPLLLLFVKRWFRRADEEKQALLSLVAELRGDLRQLRERIEGGLGAHRDQLEAVKRELVEHDTRLAFREGRYGAEPLTSPGSKPSAALEAFRAEQAKKADLP